MKLEDLMETYERLQLPSPAPKGRPYTILGTPPPSIQLVANVASETVSSDELQSLSTEELWIAAIYYCQGVIRSNLTEGRIHFRELDAGMDDLSRVSVGYKVPGLSDLSPNVAFRFADITVDDWRRIYRASESARRALFARVAMNFEANVPVPPSLLKIVGQHLVNPEEVSTSSRDRKHTKDRDTLFVWLAKRVSEVCMVPVAGAPDKILSEPLPFTGVTVVGAAFTGIGIGIKPKRSVDIFDENKNLLGMRLSYRYLLKPDFLEVSFRGTQSNVGEVEPIIETRFKQLKTALGYVLSPDLGRA